MILAGGQSSRYGKPKMFEQYKGIPFYRHSVSALTGSGIESVYIITNEQLSEHFDQTDVNVLVEKESHKGPLAALTFAMDSIKEADWYIVLAADIPFITPELVRSLIDHTTDTDPTIDAIVPVTGEKEQPLIAMYHRRCLPIALELLENNQKSMRPLLQKGNVKYIQFPDTQVEFTNINYESDWKKMKDKERRT
ncbi:molybdenum cofactor guanylyltransferase [Alkalihalophilus sp. As8PL]|uniref:Probable molybdenum cofactor guanylyltransferase n=1 Tax=Alkalihalophilus sp. As8PL TaxID=3237103 RepID=A0AB39BWM1_9BACI